LARQASASVNMSAAMTSAATPRWSQDTLLKVERKEM
jgi:hypothetical protein